MKKFMSGLIVGIMITVSMSVFADNIGVKTNPFPILVNGVKQAIGAYNINDSTYIKLSDVAKATEGVVNVKFDGDKQVININTAGHFEVKESVAELPEVVEEVVNKVPSNTADKEYTSTGIRMIERDGKEFGLYHSLAYDVIERGLNVNGNINFNSATMEMFVNNHVKLQRIGDVPYIETDGDYYIEMDYYYNTILPFLE